VATFIADLSSQAAVRRLAAEVLDRYPKLDVLINNAGAMYGTWKLTKDGIELTWAVNHLAPFLLSKLLLHRLKESAPARIITTASHAHRGAHIPFDDLNAERSYWGFGRYCETKLANILFTTELARRLDGTRVTANCFHPGLVATGFNRNNGLLMNLGMTILKPAARSPEKDGSARCRGETPNPAHDSPMCQNWGRRAGSGTVLSHQARRPANCTCTHSAMCLPLSRPFWLAKSKCMPP
jgi:NAD(P)-dependent dehydrogenase (short-subunit alcohol dehydrogenase family)